MFNKLTIKNFQSHKHTKLDFVMGLNFLNGGPDVGKTSVLRAISYLTVGKPNGFGFHSNWCKHGDKTEVRLDMDNGYIHRSKSKSKNTWDCNGLELNATGVGVPDNVAEVVNWGEVNYSPQHGGAFLLTDSDGAVAKKMNALVNLDIIDRTIGKISKEVKDVNRLIKVKKEAVADIDVQLELYSDLDDASKEMKKLDLMEQKYFSLDDRYHELKTLISSIESLEGELGEDDIDGALEAIELLIELDAEVKTKKSYLESMKSSLSVVMSTHKELSAYSEVDKAACEVAELISTYSDVEEKKSVLCGLKSSLSAVGGIVSELKVYKGVDGAISDVYSLLDICDTHFVKEDFLVKVKAQFVKVMNDAKLVDEMGVEIEALEHEFKEAMGDRCPLCEGEVG